MEKTNTIRKILYWVLGILGAAGLYIAGDVLLPSESVYTEVPKVIEVQTGEEYVNRFKDNTTGKIVEEKITKQEYDALGLKGAGQPKKTGYTWLDSLGGKPVIATSAPELKDNEFYVISTSTNEVMLKLPGKGPEIKPLQDVETADKPLSRFFGKRAKAAIQLDSVSVGTEASASSITWSHTISATSTNMIFFVTGYQRGNGRTTNSITYNGDNLTAIGSDLQCETTYYYDKTYLWYLINPDTGTHNAVATFSSSNYAATRGVSYSGVEQNTDHFVSTTGTSQTITDYYLSVTSTADNSWLVFGGFSRDYNNGAYTGGTQREFFVIDTNGPKSPAGAYNIGLHQNAGPVCAVGKAAAIAPAAAAAATYNVTPRDEQLIEP